MPVTVTFSGTNRNISYIYDAVGTKLKKVVTDASSLITTEYAGNYVYENSVLQFFNHAEGYVEPNGTGWQYVFQYKDHLGNIRLSYADSNGDGVIATTEIREENNYYPFGLKHKGYNNAQTGKDHKYGFGNKEEQDELNLAWLDFGARNYDAALGRWMNLDPFVELYNGISPYNYVKNNPVYFIDPDGNRVDISDIFSSEEKFQKGMQILLDLSEQTGLSLTVNKKDGLLQYGKGEDGKEKVEEKDGQKLGSEDARNSLIKAIDHDDTVKVSLAGLNIGSKTGGNDILLDPTQIGTHIGNVSEGLNPKTLGFGLTFLHELFHTDVGGGLRDTEDEFSKGPVVEKMNVIRQQLDANPLNQILGKGTQYGIRKYYMSSELSRRSVNKRLDLVRSRISFSILNKNGNKRGASTETQAITDKRKEE